MSPIAVLKYVFIKNEKVAILRYIKLTNDQNLCYDIREVDENEESYCNGDVGVNFSIVW